MTFEEMLAGLTAEQKALIDSHESELSAKKNSEAKGLRERMKAQDEILTAVKTKFGIDEVTKDVIESIDVAQKKTDSAPDSALLKRLQAIEQSNKDLLSQLSAAKEKDKLSSRDSELRTALSKSGFAENKINLLLSATAPKAEWSEDAGKWLIDGKTVSEHAESLKKEYPDFISNPIKGTQTRTSDGFVPAIKTKSDGTPEYRFVSESEYNSMDDATKLARNDDVMKSVSSWDGMK